MALNTDVGGANLDLASVQALVLAQARWLRATHAQAELFWREYAQLLNTDALKTAAGVSLVNDDKFIIDTLGSVMLQIKTLLEGGIPAQVTDTRDFCTEVIRTDN